MSSSPSPSAASSSASAGSAGSPAAPSPTLVFTLADSSTTTPSSSPTLSAVTIDCHAPMPMPPLDAPMPPLNQDDAEKLNATPTDIYSQSSTLKDRSSPHPAESFYINSGNDKKVLFAMAIGMEDEKSDRSCDK